MSSKYVYAFGGGTAEGDTSLKPLLGGKGAGLAEMARLGVPVPPGFTITTEACIRDAYRRLLTMYGDVVMGVPHKEFEAILEETRDEEGVATDPELSAAALARVAERYEALIEERTGKPFPQDPKDQLWGGINNR